MSNTPEISFVIPLYNEEDAFNLLITRLQGVMDRHSHTFEVVLVDDGSQDSTPEKMKQLALADHRFQSVFLSRNFGQQMALSAGLKYASGTRAMMILDGDLQDPPELFERFWNRFQEGFDVVYALRQSRKSSLLLKLGYFLFYRIMQKSSYVHIPLDSGDCSLVSRRVVNHINAMPEESRFNRGLRAWAGFRQTGIPVDRPGREQGKSKYNLRRLISLGINGIFNFSKYPIRFTMMLGIASISVAIIYFFVTLFRKLFIGDVPSGFTALLFMIIFFGGIQLIAIGTIGEYILRIFFQVKNRPLYIVQERVVKGQVILEEGPSS
jgi:dolichol-phosphate mannosyltransferase